MKQIFIVERNYNHQREILGAFLDKKSAFKALEELQKENIESMRFAKITSRPIFYSANDIKLIIG